MNPSQDIHGLLSSSGDIGYDWDLKTDSIIWFGGWRKIFPDQPPPEHSRDLYKILHADDRHIVFDGEVERFNRQFRIIGPGNKIFWIHERGSGEQDDNKQPVRQRGVWRVIDQPVQGASAEGQNRDGLTGCFKRRALQNHLSRAIDSAKLTRRTGAYMVIGVDRMSFVNEAAGTETGDAVLCDVARRLEKIMPTRAVLGRVGGDVFGILIPEPLGNDAPILAERIIHDFRNMPVIADQSPLHITVSIGSVRVPAVAKSANEAMIFAEQALHMAQQRGRNSFMEYVDSPERAQENRELLEMTERVKHAFKNDGFRLAYQPIVDADSSAPIFYEALIRMFDDNGKPIPAAVFVPLIEQLGMASELDRLVLALAVRVMQQQPKLNLAINISGLTASQMEWNLHIQEVLHAHPDVARRLTIEITETAAIVDIGETRRFVDTLRAFGGRVALDDFGAGSTSIRYLRELGLSIMKIDKALLNDLLSNREQQHLVTVLINLARGMNIQTVAEGVETEEIAAWLRDAKVDFMQGYYFGKPSLDLPS